MGCELVYALVPKSGTFAELSERPVRDRAARDVKSVMHTMMLEDQKPENADQLIEDEAQRRLKIEIKHDELHPHHKLQTGTLPFAERKRSN